MTMLSTLIGCDASRLLRPRRLVVGLAILGIAPALLIADWASAVSQTAI